MDSNFIYYNLGYLLCDITSMASNIGEPEGSKAHILYCKHSTIDDIQGDLSFFLCSSINRIHKNQALGAQKLKTLWIIIVRSLEARESLLLSGVTVNNTFVQLYAKNPYDVDCETERIIIKDLPLWESNALVSDFFKSQPHIKLTSEVMFSKARNDTTKRSSSFLNGDRFLYVQAGLDPPLPANIKIGRYTCRVWRSTKKSMKCMRCASTDHNTKDTNKCAAYVSKHKDTLVFTRGVLSNFDKCTVEMDGMKFMTSEHAYQWRACTEALREDLAEKVISTKFPIDAKNIAAEIKSDDPNSHWNVIKYDVMREVLQAKIDSSATFRDALLDTGDMKLAEGREDMIWGSGLTFSHTITTKPEYWPGSNKLGSILESLRSMLRSASPDVEVKGRSAAAESKIETSTPASTSTTSSVGTEATSSATEATGNTVPVRNRRTVIKPAQQRTSSLRAPSSHRKKNGKPLYQVFMKNRISKRRKRHSTGSSDSNTIMDTHNSDVDSTSVASFVTTRDYTDESPNDLRDFDS